jgi:hypothetical protein
LELQDETLKIMLEKMENTVMMLESLIEKHNSSALSKSQIPQEFRVKRTKYAMSKEKLTRAIEDLEAWQEIFDPSWYLIIKAAIPQIDVELAKYSHSSKKSAISSSSSLRYTLTNPSHDNGPIWLKEEGIANLNILDIPFSSARLVQRPDGRGNWILEEISYPTLADPRVLNLTRDIRDLARKLLIVEPITFGLLNCKGVVKQEDRVTRAPISFTFVFRMPENMSHPVSLRNLLLLGNFDHSLSGRFIIANQLAKSVFYMHNFGFVHKNVRPENILILKDPESPIGRAYLIGFEHFRSADGATARFGDTAWQLNLYRHPRRQGNSPEEHYIMQHDIYSLGVSLLELGLWESFVNYKEDVDPWPTVALGLSIESPEFLNPDCLKDHLVSIARSVLPRRMGTKYAKVVETCLTCLDPDNTDFGDESEFQDTDGILIGVRYVEKVDCSHILLKLYAYCLKILIQLNAISV